MDRKKRCEKCDVEITYKNWARHLRSKAHLKNDPDQTIRSEKTPIWCKSYKLKITSAYWTKHLQTKRHTKNASKQPKPIKAPKVFTNPKQTHKVFNFSNALFKDR
jgi:hypothetical protein